MNTKVKQFDELINDQNDDKVKFDLDTTFSKSKSKLKHLLIQNFINADKYRDGKTLNLKLIENEQIDLVLNIFNYETDLKVNVEY